MAVAESATDADCRGASIGKTALGSEMQNAEPAGKRATLREYAEAELRRQGQSQQGKGSPGHSRKVHTWCERIQRRKVKTPNL